MGRQRNRLRWRFCVWNYQKSGNRFAMVTWCRIHGMVRKMKMKMKILIVTALLLLLTSGCKLETSSANPNANAKAKPNANVPADTRNSDQEARANCALRIAVAP